MEHQHVNSVINTLQKLKYEFHMKSKKKHL